MRGGPSRKIGALIAAVAALTMPAARISVADDASAVKRPNIIYVMTDDQGYGDIAAHGNPVIKTPNLDRMHRESVRLTEFHASPTCSPTRAALLTGRHEFRSGVTHTIFERERLVLSAVTLPQVLKTAGYTTGIFGKWHLGDEDAYQPGNRGFDRVFIHGGGGIGQSYPGSCGDAPGNTYFDPVIRSDGTFLNTKGYCTDVFFDTALQWIEAQRKAGKPFFCYLTPNAPHDPLDCPPGSDTPYLEPLEAAGIADPNERGKIAKFYGMIENIDTNIGRLLGKLDEWGLADDTLVVFTTDNGTATGAPVFNAGMRARKGSPYRGGTRVPSYWRWKGRLPEGMDIPAVTAHIDVLPTLCDLADVPLPPPVAAQVEGRSFALLLRGARIAWPDRPLVTHVGRWDRGKAAESAYRNCRIREGRWSLVNVKNTPDAWELYDLAADPAEESDVAKEHPDVVARLAAEYDRWWAGVRHDLVNEDAHGPAENPFKTAYVRQFDPPPALPDARSGPRRALPPGQPGKDPPHTAASPVPPRPNVLFIIVDDQSPFDFKFYNPASTLRAPVIERLAAEGMVLDAAYHMGSFSGAVCTPSRHMLMCGRSVWHLPIGPAAAACPPGIERFTLAPVFNAVGYDTMRTCKIGNAYEAADALFTVRRDATKRGGTAESGSIWHGDQVMAYLADRKRTKDTDPFLIFFGFSHPHDTRDGMPELLANYGATNHADEAFVPPTDPKQPPLPPNWLPQHPFDHGHLDVRDEVGVSGVGRRRDPATIRNELGREYACSELIDRQIGRVLEALEAQGELENTLIFYTSDHGIAIGRHGLEGKQNLYEHTWRVPFIVKGPGVQPGSRAPGNIYLGDTLATLCDICGITPPETNEGTSFRPVLEGKVPAIRDVLYGVYCGGQKPGIRSVRRGDWKLIKYESPSGGLHTQLFNLTENPHEFLAEHRGPEVVRELPAPPAPGQKNLAADPGHAAMRAELEALLGAEMRRHDDPFRFSDQSRPEAE
jgi:choline-sulfatase